MIYSLWKLPDKKIIFWDNIENKNKSNRYDDDKNINDNNNDNINNNSNSNNNNNNPNPQGLENARLVSGRGWLHLRGRKNSWVLVESLSKDGVSIKTLVGETLKHRLNYKWNVKLRNGSQLKSMKVKDWNHWWWRCRTQIAWIIWSGSSHGTRKSGRKK